MFKPAPVAGGDADPGTDRLGYPGSAHLMAEYFVYVDLDGAGDELDRLARGPGGETVGRMEGALLSGFATTEGRVHVISGYLKSTLHPSSSFSGDTWEGEMSAARYPGIYELARGNRLRHGVEHFAARVASVIDQLNPDQRQELLRLIIEDVQVTGWHVKIRLRIPLDNPPDGDHTHRRTPRPGPTPASSGTSPLSTEDRLRSLHGPQRRFLPAQGPRPRPGLRNQQTRNELR